MSKLNGNLSYKDWCILKHGLKNQIDQKEGWIEMNSDGVETREDERKELEEEKTTLERVTKLVDGYKRYISGQEKDYERRIF